jgi:O-antigen ligase
MEQYVSVDYYDEFQTPLISDEDGRVSAFIIFLVPFITAAISVECLSGLNYLVKGLGVICFVAYLMAAIRGTFVLPKEVMLFFAYVAWSSLGIFTAKAPTLHRITFFTILQFSVMITIIAHYSNNIKMTRILLFSVLVGAAIVGTASFVTGQYQRATLGGDIYRATSLGINANTFSMTLVFAAAILLYLFETWKSWIMKVVAIGLMLLIALLIIASGSRAGFVSFVLLLPTWFFISYRKEIIKRPAVAILTLIMLLAALGFLFSRVAGTHMQERLDIMLQARETGGGGSIQIRVTMLKEGLAIIKSHPLFGVGLNHFLLYSSSESYSHNNYVEVFCNSGIPGGILYYSIFVVLWLRLRRLSKLSMESRAKGFVNMAKAFVIIRLVSDIATMSYSRKISWIIVAILVGFSYQLEQKVKARMLTEHSDFVDEFQLQPEGY